jgi:putative DNA primase/helicase
LVVKRLISEVLHELSPNAWKVEYEREIWNCISLSTEIISDMNSNRYINFKNGVLDLITFEMIPHSPETFTSYQMQFDFNEGAEAPRFRSFMCQITGSEPSLEAVLKECLADLIMPEQRTEVMYMWIGNGANGKSTLSKLISKMFDEDAISHVSLSSFGKQFGLQNLIGKRLNIANENELSAYKVDTENLKAIVSGDKIHIDIKYKKPQEIQLPIKLLFLMNSLPISKDSTFGLLRKTMLIPFNQTFKDENCDRNLIDSLSEEMPGVFNYILEGIIALRGNGYRLTQCEAVEQLRKTYYSGINPAVDFFNEAMVVEDGSSVSKKETVEAYAHWCNQSGIDIEKNNMNKIFWERFKNVCSMRSIKYEEKKVNGYYHLKNFAIKEIYKPKPTQILL